MSTIEFQANGEASPRTSTVEFEFESPTTHKLEDSFTQSPKQSPERFYGKIPSPVKSPKSNSKFQINVLSTQKSAAEGMLPQDAVAESCENIKNSNSKALSPGGNTENQQHAKIHNFVNDSPSRVNSKAKNNSLNFNQAQVYRSHQTYSPSSKSDNSQSLTDLMMEGNLSSSQATEELNLLSASPQALNRQSSDTSATPACFQAEGKQEKHEQRRQNLRRRRSREQIMQVVDMFVNEATLFTVYQAYVHANFLNDMMNAAEELLSIAVAKGLRIIVREVESEIVIADWSGKVMQTVLLRETKTICKHALKECQSLSYESQEIQFSDDLECKEEYKFGMSSLLEEGRELVGEQNTSQAFESQQADENQVTAALKSSFIQTENSQEESQPDFKSIIDQSNFGELFQSKQADQSLNESGLLDQYLEASHFSQDQIEQDCQESEQQTELAFANLEAQVVAQVLEQQIKQLEVEKEINEREEELRKSEDMISEDLISLLLSRLLDQQLIADDIKGQVLQSQLQKLLLDITIENISEESKRNQIQKQILGVVMEEAISSELKAIVQETLQVEREMNMLSSEIAQECLDKAIETSLIESVAETVIQTQVLEGVLASTLKNSIVEIQEEARQEQEALVAEQSETSANEIIEATSALLCREIAGESLILFESVYFYVQLEQSMIDSLLNSTVDKCILQNELFDTLLLSILKREFALQIQIERDAAIISSSLLTSSIDKASLSILDELIAQDQSQKEISGQVLEQTLFINLQQISSEALGMHLTGDSFIQLLL